ncbi:hypothetical protein BG011_009998 [Mortierella polycephala]|uniref:gluconokinase n=1 Tax=Mortierella polycephala TaxID=41804 RepID=A0A9P6TVA0_9FUNG|nr:hypothetical protein BG011_009998 [Mortierella polycephala]
MEEKKRSTLGKAFSRTFSRKSHLPPPAAAPVAAPAPVVAPAPAKPIETVPSNGTLTPAATPVSPISVPTPNMTSVSSPESINAQVDFPMSPKNNAMHTRDNTGVSNASTISRHGHTGEDGEGLNPADILLNRLTAFKGVIKNLQYYFTEVTEVERGVSKTLNKASGVLVVPFKDGQQFLEKGGFQDVCAGIRDSTKTRSDQHASAARFVEETIVKNLRRLKQDIKGKIKAHKADTNLYSNKVFKEREATQEKIADLAKAIALFDMSGQRQPDMEKMHSDPYVVNVALKRQLAKQVHEENLFARALKQLQDEVKTFEAHIIKETKQILNSFAEYELNSATSAFSQSWAPTQLALNVLEEDSEWNSFMERHGHRLFPSDLVDTNPDDLDYPCKDSPYILPVKAAHLSRQSSVLKSWKEGYFVLTLAGWLHAFSSADHAKDAVPDHSIYIPTATLGSHSEAGQKQHVFSLEGKGKGGLLHRDAQTFTLRAHSREEMVEWWSEISKRAQSSTFTQPGDGSLNALSRSGSTMKSSSAMHPQVADHTHEPSPPYSEHLNEGATASAPTSPPVSTSSPVAQPTEVAPAPVAVAVAEAAPVLERNTTGSTVSLNKPEVTPAPAPGVSGSGKSTMGQALADSLAMPFIDGDDLHSDSNVAKMAAGHPLTDADRDPWLKLIRTTAEQQCLLQEQKRQPLGIVVACSALKAYYRDILRGKRTSSLQQQQSLPTYFVFLKGTRDVLLQRMEKRDGHFMKTNMLDSQLETLESPEGEHGVVVIDITDAPTDQVKKARDRLLSSE